MNGVVLPAWLDTLLAIVGQAQFGLLRLWHWLGLTGEAHGQPAWPWSRRIAGETLLIDLGVARQLVWAGVPCRPRRPSFHASPTGFSVEAIAVGARIYGQHCAACHGDDGRGEGPLAATLPRCPPTLVEPLPGRRADGELFSDADLLGESGQAGKTPSGNKPTADGLTAPLLRMDAEPVRFVKGGIVH